MSNPPEVLVVGAGIAGLTAAHELQKAGCAVRLLEANDHPGGRMVIVDWEGFRVDAGARVVPAVLSGGALRIVVPLCAAQSSP